LQGKAAKDKPDADRAEASLRKIVSIVFDIGIDRRPDACDDARSRAWDTIKPSEPLPTDSVD
jgi:hypothetical protein